MKKQPLITIDAKYLGMKFDQLIKKYTYLNKFLLNTSPPKFDLGDPITLSELNKCLFKELGELEITVPPNYLIPAYSLRAAYAQVINNLVKNDKPIIEIGTGASATIALILAKKYGKKIFATEINPESYKSAKKNIQKNNLEERIILLKSKGEIINGIIPKGYYAALLSYPPIYPNDLTKLEKKRGWKGVETELIAGKQELDFCYQLLDETIENDEVKINYITLQVMNFEQLNLLFKKYSDKGKCQYAIVKVGTRQRYIFIFSKDLEII